MNNLTIESYTLSDWSHVAALLESWPFKPLSGHACWPAGSLTALCRSRLSSTLKNQQTFAWVVRTTNTIQGFVTFNVLPWDSNQINLPAARLDYFISAGSYDEQCEVKRTLLATALHHGVECDIKHLSTRIDAANLSGLHVLEHAGFITVDGILTFALEQNQFSLPEQNRDIRIRLATPDDCDITADLARQTYIFDRFHSDPTISQERADELHAEWLRNSCLGRVADAVILAEDSQGLIGFVTCKLHDDTKEYLNKLVGTIVLVATAKRAQRKGVARATTLGALDWFRRQGVDIVEVGTQLRNIPAARLYESCGFRLVGSSVSLRKLL